MFVLHRVVYNFFNFSSSNNEVHKARKSHTAEVLRYGVHGVTDSVDDSLKALVLQYALMQSRPDW